MKPPSPAILSAPRRRLMPLLLLRAVAAIWSAGAALLLLLFIVDATLILPLAWRAQAGVLLLLAGLIALALSLLGLRQLQARRLASQLERQQSQLGSALSNAVALEQAAGSTALNEHLRQQAVAYGRAQAARAQIWPLARPSVLATAALAGLLLLWWLLSPLLAKDMMAALWPRFLDPHGDHPPYSRLSLSIQPASDEVLYGGALEVRGEVRGGAVDRLYLFARGADGEEASQTVMFRSPDGSFVQTLTNIREAMQVWVGDGRARSQRRLVEVRRSPQITLLEADLSYPEHTRREAESRVLDDQELRLPRRSQIRLRVASNRPLAGGSLLLQPLAGGEAVELTLAPHAEQVHSASTHFTLLESMAYELRITDQEGLTSQHPQRGRVVVEADRPPRIHIMEPGRDAVSTPQMAIPIEVLARDDYGIEAIHWLRSINGSIHDVGVMDLQAINNDPARVQSLSAFDLKDLGLRPGDRIEYIFEAVDNDPDGPQIATSIPYVVDIISEEAYRAALRQQDNEGGGLMDDYLNLAQTAQRMEERARALAEALAGEADEAAISAMIQGLAEDFERYSQQLDTLAERAIDNPLLSALDQRLAELLPGLDAAGEAIAALLNAGPDMNRAEEAQKLAAALADFAVQAEAQLSEPARHIDRLNQLAQTARALDGIIEEQLLIAQWSRRFLEDQQNDERLARMQLTSLADQQQRLLDAFLTWLEDLQGAIDGVPDNPAYDALLMQAHELRERLANAGVQAEQAAAAGYFGSLAGDEGHLAALRAWRLLTQAKHNDDGDDLLQQLCEGAGECLRQVPGLSDLPGEALGSLMDLLHGRGRGAGGPGEGSGYSSLSSNRAVYGPDTSGSQSGRGDTESGQDQGRQLARRNEDAADPDQRQAHESLGGVRLQPDLPFPLHYRSLVGDYFRAIAEGAGAQSGQSPF